VSENQTHISEVSEIMARPRIVRPIRCSRRKALRKWKLRGNKVGGLYGDTESRFKLLIPDGIIVGHTPHPGVSKENGGLARLFGPYDQVGQQKERMFGRRLLVPRRCVQGSFSSVRGWVVA
jgi:hypothetical protein